MKKVIFCLLLTSSFISGCTIVPSSEFLRACQTLKSAFDEVSMPEVWYTEASHALNKCGYDGVLETGKIKACYARKFNDSSIVCEEGED